jgi:hypothetical protein
MLIFEAILLVSVFFSMLKERDEDQDLNEDRNAVLR